MSALPKWYKPVAVVALLWNLVGASAYLMDVTTSPDAVAKMTDAQRAMYESRPAWFVAAYACAVWFGVGGSLGLVLRKRWATPMLAVSLLGLVAQDVALFSRPEVQADMTVIGLQGMVFIIAVLLLWLSRTSEARGWTT
jgi:hypothetical protein